MKGFAKEYGFTLVEIILAVTISAVLVVGFFRAFSVTRKSGNFNFNQNYNILESKRVLSQISNDLRYADVIYTPDIGLQTTNASFTINGLNAQIHRVTTGPDADTIVVDYYDGGVLKKTKKYAKSLTQSLTFTRNSTSTINVSIKLKNKSHFENPEMNLSTTVRMLNVK